MHQNVLEAIPGYEKVVDHFGRWPSFHDGEIVQLRLDHSGASTLSIHTWNMTSELDEKGYYRLTDHGAVHFTLTGITDVELFDFNVESVIFGLRVNTIGQNFEIVLDPCFGLSGRLRCKGLALNVQPYSPA